MEHVRGTSDARADPDEEGLPAPLAGPIQDFLDAARAELGLARSSLRAYRSDLRQAGRWLSGRGRTAWTEVEAQDVVDWLGARRARGDAEASIARGLVAVRLLLRFLIAEGLLQRDPTALLPAPVLRRTLPHVLSAEDVERLLGAIEGDDWRALRDRALLEVLYACGARVSEAVRLRVQDLEPRLRILRLHGKGDKMRLVPLGGDARSALERWLAEGRPQVPGHARRREVFLTRRGHPLDRTNAWRRVKAIALAAGLPGSVRPHTLRHSFASHLIEGGADLRAVQEMLGHASIRTTEVYTHLDAENVRALHRLYHPRG